MENFVHNTISILAGIVLLVSSTVSALPSKIHDFTNKFAYHPTNSTNSRLAQTNSTNRSVLGATVDKNVTGVTFTIPAFFKDLVTIGKTLEVTGDITAPNVIYGLKAGTNITITGGQNPTINAGNSGVTQLGGKTGDLSLAAGSGISVSGLTISNSDTGSAQSIFKTIKVSGQDNIAASSNTDALTFVAGTGVALTTDATNKKLTIDASSAALNSGWTDGGTTVSLVTSTDSVGIGTTPPGGAKLSVGTGAQFRINESGNLTRINDVAYSFPSSQGAASTVLVNDGSGSLTWGALSAGSFAADSLDFTEFKDAMTLDANLEIVSTSSNYSVSIDGGTFFVDTANNRVGIGSSSPSTTLYVAGTGTVTGAFSAGAATLASLNNSSGGITNAGAITGATGLTSTGTITFGSLGVGIAHLSVAGVLSSSAVNIAGSDITGTLATTSGGTGITAYSTGDMLYGSATNVLSRLGIGGSGQVLSVANGIPTWSSVLGGPGGLCSDCIINDPGSTQTISPTGSSTVGLVVKATSTGGGTPDIFKVTDSGGSTAYLRVDSTGSVILGNGGVSAGTFTINPSGYDPIAISPVAQGAGAFTGTLTSLDLTAARTWTLPNATGSICLDTGNCAGSGSNLGGSGTANYLTRWNSQYVLENGSVYDNGSIGIGTTAPLAKLDDSGTAWLRGSGTTTGLYVASSGNVGIGTTGPSYALDVVGTTNISAAVTLGSTLNVTGAATLSSTADITGRTTIGGNLQVNGAGNSWIMGNVGIGTSSPTSTLTFGNASTLGLATSTTALNVQSGLMDFDTSNSRVGVGTTAPQATFDVTDNAISTGTGLLVSSTSTSFSSGMLASIDWSPSSSTVATGDLLSINVGANGVIGNIFNVKDNGTSVFSVSQTAITAGLPASFNAAGDVNIAYDLLFTNQTSGNIKSLGPLAIEAGESFESNFLTLRTFNAGQLILDLSGGATLNQGQTWTLASSRQALNLGSLLNLDTTFSRVGIGITAPMAGLDVSTTAWLRGIAGGASGLFVNSSGNVGIGTTGPQNKLDVSGSVAFGSLPANPLPQSNSAYFSGNVGLGTTSPAGKLAISGGDLIIGSGTFNNTSANEDAYVTGNLEVDGTIYGSISGGINPNLALGSVLYQGASAIAASPSSFYWDSTNNRLGLGNSAPGADLDIGSSATTGTGLQITSNSLTTGKGLYVTSTSTGLTTGNLLALDWSPGSSTTATGDILSINVGANGVIGNIFNVKDNGTSVFSVSQTAITAGLPTNFTAPGDLGVAYDLVFTNPVSSNIKSSGPLALVAGETFNSSSLTLATYNAGQLVLDLSGGVTLNQGQTWTLATSQQALNFGSLLDLDTTNSRIGIGTTTPQNKLDVSGSVAFGSLPSNPLPQSNSAYFSGNVGLGTTNPSTTLDVVGTGKFSSTLTASNGLTLTTGAWNITSTSGTEALTLSSSTTAFNVQSGLFNIDTANSRIGIGTTAPQNKLDVSGSVAFGSLSTTALPQSNSAYFSGNVGIGTTNPSTSLQIVGGNCSDDAGGGGCTADYAELYPSSENVEKGDVLAIDSGSGSVKRADRAYASNLIGIVSSAPAAIADGSKLTFMNNEYVLDPRRPAVALAGRVPVKIDPNSPAISAGDALTSSTMLGMAMKATKAGPIIGKALAAWSPDSGKDKILVFVNNSWFDPTLVLNETGEVKGATSTMASVTPNLQNQHLDSSPSAQNDNTVILNEVKDLGVKVDALTEKINQIENQHLDSSPSTTLGVQNDKGVGDSSPVILSGAKDLGVDASASAVLGAADSLITGQEATLSALTVSGLAKLNDLNVIGNANIGFLQLTGMDLAGGSNIDTIAGPLRLQSTALNDLDIMNGKVLISKEGNIVTTGEITAKKLNILEGSVPNDSVILSGAKDLGVENASIGTGTLKKNTKSVVISTTALTKASHVFVTPKTLLDYPLVVTLIKPKEGFTVEVKQAEDKDIDFDWFIIN